MSGGGKTERESTRFEVRSLRRGVFGVVCSPRSQGCVPAHRLQERLDNLNKRKEESTLARRSCSLALDSPPPYLSSLAAAPAAAEAAADACLLLLLLLPLCAGPRSSKKCASTRSSQTSFNSATTSPLLSPVERLCVGVAIACPNAGAWKSPTSWSPVFKPTLGSRVEPRDIV